MWWKKILYGIISILMTLGIMMITATSSFQKVFDEQVKTAVENKNYQELNSYFYYVSNKSSQKLLTFESDDGAQIEIDNVIVKQPHYSYDNVTFEYEDTYESIEQALSFSIFNLPDSFLSNEDEHECSITLTLSNSNIIELAYSSNDDIESVNYHIDFVQYYEKYCFLANYITKSAFESKAGSFDIFIKSIEIKNDDGEIWLSKTFEDSKVMFKESSLMWSTFESTINTYSEASLAYYNVENVPNLKARKAAFADVEELVDSNADGFVIKADEKLTLQNQKMVIRITLALSLSVTFFIVLGNFLFSFGARKGIYKNIPQSGDLKDKILEEKTKIDGKAE